MCEAWCTPIYAAIKTWFYIIHASFFNREGFDNLWFKWKQAVAIKGVFRLQNRFVKRNVKSCFLSGQTRWKLTLEHQSKFFSDVVFMLACICVLCIHQSECEQARSLCLLCKLTWSLLWLCLEVSSSSRSRTQWQGYNQVNGLTAGLVTTANVLNTAMLCLFLLKCGSVTQFFWCDCCCCFQM